MDKAHVKVVLVLVALMFCSCGEDGGAPRRPVYRGQNPKTRAERRRDAIKALPETRELERLTSLFKSQQRQAQAEQRSLQKQIDKAEVGSPLRAMHGRNLQLAKQSWKRDRLRLLGAISKVKAQRRRSLAFSDDNVIHSGGD